MFALKSLDQIIAEIEEFEPPIVIHDEDILEAEWQNWFMARELGEVMNHAYYNAHYHGQHPFKTTIYIGKRGVVVSLADSGEGFDFSGKIRQFRAGETYWKNFGFGFRCFDEEGHFVSYEGKGNIINIQKFNQGLPVNGPNLGPL